MKKQPLKLLLLGLLCSLLLPSVHAQTVAEPARVIIVFDASGSMAGEVEGRAKIDIAKEVVSGIVSGFAPEVELGSSKPGPQGISPKVGFMPTSPQCAAGRRVDPPASVANASAPMPTAVALTAPPDEPPGVSAVFQGERVLPCGRLLN